MSNLAVPVQRTYSVGEYETGAFFNSNVRDATTFLLNIPICNAVQATTQSISNALWTPLTLDSTIVDSYGGHSNTTNNSYYTAQVSGWYLLSASVCFATNATGWRGVRVIANGATAIAGSATEVLANTVAAGLTTIASAASITYLTAGQYVQAEGYQTSGGALSTSVNNDAACAITAVWLHA